MPMCSQKVTDDVLVNSACNRDPTMDERSSRDAGHPYHSIVARDSVRVHAGDVNLHYVNTGLTQEQRCHQAFKTST